MEKILKFLSKIPFVEYLVKMALSSGLLKAIAKLTKTDVDDKVVEGMMKAIDLATKILPKEDVAKIVEALDKDEVDLGGTRVGLEGDEFKITSGDVALGYNPSNGAISGGGKGWKVGIKDGGFFFDIIMGSFLWI